MLQLCITPPAFAGEDVNTIRKHARYVLRESLDSDISIYLYASDEKDVLCDDNLGGVACQTENDHEITGHYKLIVMRVVLGVPDDAEILSSVDVGGKTFRPVSPNNLQPEFFKIPKVKDKFITIKEAANSMDRTYTTLFRLDDKNKIFPVKFFLKDGKEFNDSGDLSVEYNKLRMYISWIRGDLSDEEFKERKMPGKYEGTAQTIYFTYKDGNFYESE